MRVHGGADGQVFVEVQASQGQNGPDVWKTGWPPVSPKALLDGAYDTAKAYTDEWVQAFEENAASGGDDWGTFDLATAILGKDAVDRIVAQSAQDKRVLKDLVDLEWAIIDAINGEAMSGFVRPDIGFKSMDDGLNGYFDPDAGRIWLSHDIQTWDADARDRVVLEELGEALAAHVEANELEPDKGEVLGEGDVGNRLMKVFLGEPFEDEDFIAKGSDTALVSVGEGGEDEVEASAEEDLVLEIDVPEDTRTPEELAAEWGVNVDTVTGMIPIAETITDGPPWTAESFAEVEGWDLVVGAYGTDGVMTFNNLLRAFVEQAVYLGQSGSNPDIPGRGDPGVVPESLPDLELAAEWGHPLSDVSEARAIAREIYDRNGFTGDQGFTLGDHDSITWDPMIRIYGQDAATDTNDPVLQVDELARAITEGAFTTTVNSAGEVVFDAVNLESVSTTTIVDATWAYVERDSGGERTNITAAHLKEASDYIVGQVMATDVLVTDGEEAPVEPLSIFSEEHYGLIEGLFADQPSANGTVDRFSKDAVQDIWDTGVFLRGRDFPAHSNLHPIPGFGEIGYALSEENAAAVTPAEPTDPVEDEDALIIDGQWYSFGYYGDGDGDGIINGLDPDAAFADYVLEDIPPTAEMPEDAVVDTIQDFGTGENTFGVQNVRIATYVDPDTGDGVVKVIDMTEGSETLGKSIQTMLIPSDGSVEVYMGDEDEASLILSSDDISTLATDNESRRLDDGDTPLMTGVLADLAAEGIDAASIVEEYDTDHLAYVKYTMPDNSVQISYRHQPSFMAMMADPGEYVADQVYGGTLNEDDEGWLKLEDAVVAQGQYEESSHIGQNALDGMAFGGTAGGVAGATLGALFGASTGPVGAAMFGAVGGMAGWIVGAALGGIANVVIGGAKTLYHGIQSASLLDELDSIAGTPVSESAATEIEDPGVLGTTYAAYWYPQDATIISNDKLSAEDGPYGVDTRQYIYTRGDDPHTIYSVAVDISDPDGARFGLVLHGTATTWEEQPDGTILSDVTIYDSTGTEMETVEDLDLSTASEPLDDGDILGHSEEYIAHAEGQLPADAEILQSRSVGPVTYIEYTQPDVSGTKVFMMQATKNDDGTIHSTKSTDWLNSDTVENFKLGFSYFQEAARGLMDLKMYYDATAISSGILSYMYQNLDWNAVANMFSGETNPQQMGAQSMATTLMTTSVAGLIPYAQQAMELGVQWAAMHQVPAAYSMAGICMSRHTNAGVEGFPMPGEVADIENQVTEDNPNAEEVDPPETYQESELAQFETTMAEWVTNEVGSGIAADIETNAFGTVAIPTEVDAELRAVRNNRTTMDIHIPGSVEIYELGNSPELVTHTEALLQQIVDEMIIDGDVPEGSIAKLDDGGRNEIRHFEGQGAYETHQDQWYTDTNEEGYEIVGAFSTVYSLSGQATTQYLDPAHWDDVEHDTSAQNASDEDLWVAKDGGSMDRYMKSIPEGQMAIFRGTNPNGPAPLPSEALVHRSPPGESGRDIFTQAVFIYAPPTT